MDELDDALLDFTLDEPISIDKLPVFNGEELRYLIIPISNGQVIEYDRLLVVLQPDHAVIEVFMAAQQLVYGILHPFPGFLGIKEQGLRTWIVKNAT